jgi:hypothetical protein
VGSRGGVPEEEVHVDWKDIEKPVKYPTGKTYVVIVDRESIPIILVPGIMGTRLRQSGGKRLKVWDPDAGGFMFDNYGRSSADGARKQTTLLGSGGIYDKGFVVVDEADDKHNQKFFGKRYPYGAGRGWGGVVWDGTYEPVIRGLQDRKWPLPIRTCFDLPVYAFGYDWRGSVKDAGQDLSDRVKKIKSDNPRCKKVILLTHSMGGLVARSACSAGLESDVMAVIHTVQPATGAPAAYWRMKAGWERAGFNPVKRWVVPWVLGADGLEVTALLCHIPGGLQMLPTMTHESNDGHPGWLVYNPDGAAPIRVPRTGDPYGEIYRNESDPWRLVLWKEYLTGKREASPAEIGSAWSDFLKCLDKAETFHRNLGLYQHPKSWHFFGVGRDTVDTVTITQTIKDVTPSFVPHAGYHSPMPELQERGSFSYAEPPTTDANGRLMTRFYEMSDRDGDGDSTVVRSSGRVLTIGGAPGIPLPKSGHDSCFDDNDLVGSPDLSNNISNIIESLCNDKISAEMNH